MTRRRTITQVRAELADARAQESRLYEQIERVQAQADSLTAELERREAYGDRTTPRPAAPLKWIPLGPDASPKIHTHRHKHAGHPDHAHSHSHSPEEAAAENFHEHRYIPRAVLAHPLPMLNAAHTHKHYHGARQHSHPHHHRPEDIEAGITDHEHSHAAKIAGGEQAAL